MHREGFDLYIISYVMYGFSCIRLLGGWLLKKNQILFFFVLG